MEINALNIEPNRDKHTYYFSKRQNDLSSMFNYTVNAVIQPAENCSVKHLY